MRFFLPLFCLLLANAAVAQLPASSDSSVGVGTTAPLYRLDVQSAQNNDGLRLRSLNPGQLRLVLDNMAAGKQYSLLVSGPTSAFGQGNLVITDMSRLDSARLLINGNTGYMAIGGGTTNPAEMLTVNGNVQANGLRLPQNAGLNRILASDATGMASWQPANVLNLPAGSGSFNYITKWTPNGFTLGNSQMVDDGTYVGIGNVTPQYKLDLGTAQDNDGLRLRSTNAGNLRLRFNNAGTNKEFSILLGGSGSGFGNGNLAITDINNGDSARILINGTTGNVGIGSNNISPTEKLSVNGTVLANGIRLPVNAGAGKVLTSDASGNATWQTPAGTGGAGPVIYSNWITSPYGSRDTTIDGTCVRIRHLDAPSLSTNILNQGVMLVYFRIGSIGPYKLPYISDAGGATNQVNCIFNAQKIFVYRHTYNTCRFTSAVIEAFPGQPVLINLPQSLEYRYVLLGGTQAGGRMTLGPNEHYASSLDAIPDMGPAQIVPGRVYSTARD